MSIEMQCTGCGQTLRVGDDHAGKKARCPACGAISQVPGGGIPPAPGPQPTFQTGPPKEPANPFADRPESPNPYQTPTGMPGQYPYPGHMQRRWKPHRGGVVLTLGILGLLCCMPLGIAAWVMGAIDLGEIRSGRMDPAGQTTTQVGMILGIISVVLAVGWGLFTVFAGMA